MDRQPATPQGAGEEVGVRHLGVTGANSHGRLSHDDVLSPSGGVGPWRTLAGGLWKPHNE
jgi:hypothetical protein